MANAPRTDATRPSWSPPRGAVVLALFLGSGFAGLVYEVIWSRMLTYVFGATLYAVSTVLAAFMGGLALGSFLFGRWVDRRRNPLLIYALLELGIAVSALAVPSLLRLVDPIYRTFYKSGEPPFHAITLVRLALTLAVLLIPTTLMGATLPVLSRWYGRVQERLGLSLGLLYAINTFGAVIGCYLTGFHGIAALGVRGMMFVAVGVNALVGAIALALSRAPGVELEPAGAAEPAAVAAAPDPAASVPHDVTPTTAQIVFWCYGISGAVALAYQVAWSRSLVFSFDQLKNTTYAFTAMLAVFLVGLAAGSALMTLLVDRLPEPVRCFSLIQLGIGLTGAFSLIVILKVAPGLAPFKALSDDATEIFFGAAVANVFIKTAAAILLPTLLMGMAYPVAVRICVPSLARVGRTVGDLYSINTVGAIIGALLAGFFLIPSFRIPWTIFLLCLANIAMAVVVTLNLPMIHPVRRHMVIGLSAVCVLVLLVRFPFNARFHRPEPTQVPIFYKEGPLATVSVMENLIGERTLYVDKVGVAGTDPILLTDQKSLAHIPMLFLDKPARALTVGFGSGGASWSYLQYGSLKNLDCVEICRTVLDASPFLTVSNHGLWARRDPRYRVIIDDVRSYLRFTPKRYDIIATDCTDLRYKTNANLYDYEYFQLCRSRLTSGGMVVAWMPLGGLSPEAFRLALRTFYKVFPNMAILYMNNEPTHYILLVGPTGPLRIDYRRMREKLEEKTVAADLRELLLDDADKLLSCYMTDAGSVAEDLAGERVNSENFPYLEFWSPRYGYSEKPLFDNLDWLLSKVNPVERHLKAGSYDKADLERLRRFRRAVPHIIQGHKFYRQLKFADAARAYMKAVEICPEDRATARLLNFEALQRRAERLPDEIWSRYHLGEVLAVQKRYEEAITFLEECIAIGERMAKARAVANVARNQIEQAAALLEKIYDERSDKAASERIKRRVEKILTREENRATTAPSP